MPIVQRLVRIAGWTETLQVGGVEPCATRDDGDDVVDVEPVGWVRVSSPAGTGPAMALDPGGPEPFAQLAPAGGVVDRRGRAWAEAGAEGLASMDRAVAALGGRVGAADARAGPAGADDGTHRRSPSRPWRQTSASRSLLPMAVAQQLEDGRTFIWQTKPARRHVGGRRAVRACQGDRPGARHRTGCPMERVRPTDRWHGGHRAHHDPDSWVSSRAPRSSSGGPHSKPSSAQMAVASSRRSPLAGAPSA